MLKTRVLTVVLGAPPFLACVWLGGRVWTALVALLAAAAAVEAVRLGGSYRYRHLAQALAAALASSLVLVAGGGVLPAGGVPLPWLGAITLVLLVVMTVAALLHPAGPRASDLLLAVLYPAVGFGHLVLLRGGPSGMAWVLFLLATVWAADMAAYFTGLAWGRHRLAPRLSPGKSWEGAAAGMLAALAVGAGAAPALLGVGSLAGALLGGGAGLAGMLGDLAESALKRAAGCKDSGGLLPGHGGILDRFDSLAFAAPVLYWWRVLGGM